MRRHLLGIGFLSPALIVAILFFLVPVLLTAVFSFTNMSTSTGITGGEYLISRSHLRDMEADGVNADTVDQLEAAGYEITEVGLARFEGEFGADRAEELRDENLGDTFETRRDLERVMRDLDDNPIRNTRERKNAADLFAVTIIGERFPTEAAFREALSSTGIAPGDHDILTDLAYTGWRWTTENFSLLFELPSTLRYAANTAFYVLCTLTFNVTFGLFLAISTFYLPAALANTFRTIWFLPRILPPVMYVLMWNWFTWDNGFLSIVTGWFGVPQQNWMLQTPTHAWTVIILINGFVGASLGMILFSSAAAAGAARLVLEVATDNAPALALYRRRGFVRIGVRKAYYKRPDGAIDAEIMALDLDGPTQAS